jgi:hypothetical protein
VHCSTVGAAYGFVGTGSQLGGLDGYAGGAIEHLVTAEADPSYRYGHKGQAQLKDELSLTARIQIHREATYISAATRVGCNESWAPTSEHKWRRTSGYSQDLG